MRTRAITSSSTELTSADLVDLEVQHRLPGAQTMTELAGVVLDRADNADLWDYDGNRYLDFFTGVGVCNIGHSHPRFLRQMSKQLSRIAVGTFHTEQRSRLYELLATQLPEQLRELHLFSTGSEAVEAAVKLARASTGKQDVVSFWGGFHGKTQGALSLHGGPRRQGAGPFPPGAHHVPYAYCYRCPLALTYPECEYRCVSVAEHSIRNGVSDGVAAIVVEAVQGTNGNIVPPHGYLRELRALADRLGALLVFDEVITGFGRTGELFAFQREDVVPDVLILGKAMGSGMPVSAIISRTELVAGTSFDNPSAAASTFGGNPLASAAALATLQILLDEGLVERTRTLGDAVSERVRSWSRRFPIVGNADGLGLMLGVELIEPGTTTPLPQEQTRRLFRTLLNRGVLAMAYDSRIRLYPPLTIPEDQLDEGLTVFENALQELSDRLN